MSEQNDTIFGKILRKEIPADVVAESENVLAFRDINPQAPTHVLIIPKKLIKTVADAQPEDQEVLGEMVLMATAIARDQGIAEDGYRLVINCNKAGGQEVYHLHLHLLGGRNFSWPPG